jgi:hypothetical protein
LKPSLVKSSKVSSQPIADGITQYEVKWVGYDYTTYEPETNPDIKVLVEKLAKETSKPNTFDDSRRTNRSKSKADVDNRD